MSSNPILVNIDNSHTTGIPFSSTVIPGPNINPNALPLAPNNVNSAAAYFPCSQKGGKINKKKINKISRKYKMRRNKKTVKRRLKNAMRSNKLKKTLDLVLAKNRSTKGRSMAVGMAVAGGYKRKHKTRKMRGGWAQYQNNMPVYNTYSLGGKLAPEFVGMASPPPISSVTNNAIDNLNHNALNSYGNSGAGMGHASKGWW